MMRYYSRCYFLKVYFMFPCSTSGGLAIICLFIYNLLVFLFLILEPLLTIIFYFLNSTKYEIEQRDSGTNGLRKCKPTFLRHFVR